MKKLLTFLLALALVMGTSAFAEAPAAQDIASLYTNDAHCGVDNAFGYTSLACYRDKLAEDGYQVTLVDCGDAIQGEPIGTLSTGEYIIDIMNTVGYDLAIPGNHEFDYGMERFLELVGKASFPYISSNFTKEGKLVFDAYKIIDYGTVKVGFVGITTPKTITSSTPKFFQNDKGEFIYTFCQDSDGTALYAAVQSAVDAARAEGANYIVALSHLGISADCSPWMSNDVILNTTGIDVVLDGHSHSTVECEKVKNKDGKDVLLSQTGTKMQNIGELIITADGKLSTSLLKWNQGVADYIGEI
ncbi:MAG: metallophosphoesterase, partial [Clostridia bacterium]